MAQEIFISYSRKDLERVKSIKEEIEQITGAERWMDLEHYHLPASFDGRTDVRNNF